MKTFSKGLISLVILAQLATVQAATVNTTRSNIKTVALDAGNWCYGVDGQVSDSDSYNDNAVDRVRSGSTIMVSITAIGIGETCDPKEERRKSGSIILPNDPGEVDLVYRVLTAPAKSSDANLVEEISSISLLRQVSAESVRSRIIRVIKEVKLTVDATDRKKIYVGNLPFSATDGIVLQLPTSIQDQVSHYAMTNKVVVIIRASSDRIIVDKLIKKPHG